MQTICICNNKTFHSKIQHQKYTYMIRNSKNRQRIISLFQKEHLLSAHQCYEKLKGIDLATVYRNLNQLTKLGLLKEVNIDKAENYFELASIDHQHIKCNLCGKVDAINISQAEIKPLLKGLEYSIDDIQLNITSRCGKCAKKQIINKRIIE